MNMMNMHTQTAEHLRELVMSALDGGGDEAVRAARARTVAEAIADLSDVADIASGIIGGSRALDLLNAMGPFPRHKEAANARGAARLVVDQIRATQLTSDTPGLLPRRFEPGRGVRELGGGLSLVRRFALRLDFSGGGTSPVVPGVVEGDTLGAIQTEGQEPAQAAFTIADVGDGGARVTALATALFSSQIRDWTDNTGLSLLDQILIDIADRAGETHLATELVAAAGGTRVAGADLTTLANAVDEAESAASSALNGGEVALLANPTNLPRVRRAVAASWTDQLPHPVVGTSIGLPAGTALLLALDGVHMFADEIKFMQAVRPAVIGSEVAAGRPLYLAVRIANSIQTITEIT